MEVLMLVEFDDQSLNGDVPLTCSQIRAVQHPSETSVHIKYGRAKP
jgi:hypothetical protein